MLHRPSPSPSSALRAMAVVTCGIATLTVMDGVIKGLMHSVPLGQTILLRYVFGAMAALPFLIAARPTFSWASLRANAMRSVVVVGTATSFFYAVKTLPLAEALALSFLSPLFLALIGSLLLGERVGRDIVGAIAVGLVGVLVILSGKFSAELAIDARTLGGVGAALASAVLYALALVLLRKQAAFDPPPVLVFSQAAICMCFVSPVLVLTETAPLDARQVGLFAVAGLLGTLGHLALAWGYARVEAARLGPLEYTSFLWGSALGYALFDESLTPHTLVGAALIVGACVLAARRAQLAAAADLTKT